MSSPPTLTTLPNEMIARIVDFQNKTGFEQLRLTNTHLNAFASRALAKVCFREVPVSMTRYSLEALVGICKHPVLGQYVTKISLSTRRARTEDIGKGLEGFQRSFKRGNLEDLDNAHHALQVHIKLCYEEFTLEKSGEGTRFFTTALGWLRDRGQSVLLSATDSPSFMPIGDKRAYREHSFRHMSERNGRLRSSMRVLANAAFRSGCRIDGLDIRHDCGCSACGPNSSECLIDPGDHVLGAFGAIETFSLEYNDLPSKGSLKFLELVLGISAHLEDVTMDFCCIPSRDENRLEKASIKTIEGLLCKGLTCKLKRLTLSGFPISQKSLVSILSQSSNTLQSLKLTYLTLRCGTWDLIISWVRDSFSLGQVEVDELWEIDDDDLTENGYLAKEWQRGGRVCTEGKELVKVALSKLLEGRNI